MRPRIFSIMIMIMSIIMLPAMGCANQHEDNKALSKKHEKITQQFSNVSHISPDDFSKTPSDDIIIFDVRERAEYDVSHINGALHIDPNIAPERFMALYGDKAHGKTAIFYCSVGHRSSHLAKTVQASLLDHGTRAVYNLEGGIFKWHNEDRPLQSNSEIRTPYIHPYNRYWGRMINDQSKLRFEVIAE